jgi:hypothetical protein
VATQAAITAQLPEASQVQPAAAGPQLHVSRSKLQRSIDRMTRQARDAQDLAASALARVEAVEKTVAELRIKQAESQDLRSILARYDALLCRTLAIARERRVGHGR